MNGEKDRETMLAIAQIYEKAKRYTDEGKVESDQIGASAMSIARVCLRGMLDIL